MALNDTRTESRTTRGRGRLYDDVLDTIGDTPCIRINKLAPEHVRLYVKAEFFNPVASVKDRLAVSIIEEAERRGALEPGQTVIEATSGNTGMAAAYIGNLLGYKVLLCMSEIQSLERRKVLQALGAELVLTPAAVGTKGAKEKAMELHESMPGSFLLFVVEIAR